MSDPVVGNIIEVPLTIQTTATGALVDPTTLDATVIAPDGTSVSYSYPDAEHLTRTGQGLYTLMWVGDDDGRWYWKTVTTGTGEGVGDGYVDVRALYSQHGAPLTATYATVQQLRDELDNDAALSDEACIELIVQAEDLIDEDLGARRIDETTGRKVVQANVEAWQFTKLTRATVKLAALLYAQPKINEQQYAKVTGPDFSFEGPIGSRFGLSIDPLLNQSGLRRLTTHLSSRRDRPRWDAFVYNRDGEC